MNETNVFKNLINKDPAPGTSGRLKIVSHNKICLPGWILGIDKENTVITFNQLYKIYNLTTQIIYDILDLGLTDISQRPKCPVCGEVCKFSGIKYNKTCCKKDCLSKIVTLNSQNKEEIILDKELCLKQKILSGEVQQIDFNKLSKKKIKLLNSIIKESSEDALFSRLSKLDPNPGTENRIQKVNDIFIFPGWISLDKSIVSEDGMIHIKEKSVKLIYSRSLCNPQMISYN